MTLILAPGALSTEEYTLASQMQVDMSYRSHFSMESRSSTPQLSSIKATLKLIPRDSPFQQVGPLQSQGQVSPSGDELIFSWNSPALGDYDFGFDVPVVVKPHTVAIDKKITFPLHPSSISAEQRYLQPTITIDSDSAEIRRKALDLAQGEDDLFVLSVKVADFVQNNVVYDLNTLTEKASQKASWVLRNKQGVCDEMTSLFIALMRSLGVPARFVSGISYTTSPLFTDPWQPHGWAEVYFPGRGWIPFDIAFGQFGYVDATHIRLFEGADPTDDVIFFEWFGSNVNLQESLGSFKVTVTKAASSTTDPVTLSVSALTPKVGLGSYNRIEVTLKNYDSSYAARTMYLSVPPEIEVIGSKTQTVVIEPRREAKASFIVRVPETLDPLYTYTFPIIVASERNTTANSVFFAEKGLPALSHRDLGASGPQHAQKEFAITCTEPPRSPIRSPLTATCNFERLYGSSISELCLAKICEQPYLRAGDRHELVVSLDTSESGLKTVLASASSTSKEYASLNYEIYDEPSVSYMLDYPPFARLGEDIILGIKVSRASFSVPQSLIVKIRSGSFEQKWNISTLSGSEQLQVSLQNFPLRSKTTFKVDMFWMDDAGRGYTNSSSIEIYGLSGSWWDSFRFFINRLIS